MLCAVFILSDWLLTESLSGNTVLFSYRNCYDNSSYLCCTSLNGYRNDNYTCQLSHQSWLTLDLMGKKFSRRHFVIFFHIFFFPESRV